MLQSLHAAWRARRVLLAGEDTLLTRFMQTMLLELGARPARIPPMAERDRLARALTDGRVACLIVPSLRALSGALDDSFNMEVVQAVHERLLDKIEQHKESKDPEPLTVSVQEVAAILKDCGVADTQVAAFEAQCGEQFGDGAVLNPENIIDSKHFDVKTSDASVAIDPKRSYIVETRIIDGRKYLLIPADEGVEVNGMAVGIAAADRRA